MSSSAELQAAPEKDYRTGPKLDVQALDRLAGVDRAGTESPTWRGWAVGLLAVAFMSWATPIAEMYLAGSGLTINLLPVGPMIVLLILLALHAAMHQWAGRMALTREDLTMATCMMLVSASVSSYGFVVYVTGAMAGAPQFANASNQWDVRVLPYIPDWMIPHDPPKDSADPRPIEWFMTGLPQNRDFPWRAWVVPYAYWAAMALCVFGMMFAIVTVLRKQWADRERLPFPLAQVPMEMLEGLPGTTERKSPFLKDRFAIVGMAIPFALHSWNSLEKYLGSWPIIPLTFPELHRTYLTEPPWSALGPLSVYIFPAVIGLTYLISLEVSFSLWFFYLVMKICAFVAVQMGMGASHADFTKSGGHQGFMIDQGGGALVGMVLFGFWMSRTHLADYFLRALGLRAKSEDESEGLSPRACLALFTACFTGAVVWLTAAGVGLGFSFLTIVALLIILTGITRLACEGGLFYVQSDISPSQILNVAFTPLGLGPAAIVTLGMWSRVFTFDWGRTSPMPGMMHALRLSSELKMRKRPLVAGTAIALLLALSIGFVSFMHTAYNNSGGAVELEGGGSWTMGILPQDDFKASALKVAQVLALDKKTDQAFCKLAETQDLLAAGEGKALMEEAEKRRNEGERVHVSDLVVEQDPAKQDRVETLLAENVLVEERDLPSGAKHDWPRVFWLIFGGVMLVVFMLLRTHIFWWPHPIGYVAWMHHSPMSKLWFSIFLGWLLKWSITQYGGFRVYMMLRRLFIGLVVGEIAAAGFWILIAWVTDTKDAYKIHIN